MENNISLIQEQDELVLYGLTSPEFRIFVSQIIRSTKRRIFRLLLRPHKGRK